MVTHESQISFERHDMYQPVSHAEFEDFPLKERKHYATTQASNSSLGSGLVVQEDAGQAHHHLARSRIAHDTAEQFPDTFTTSRERQQQPQQQFQTTSRAMQAGESFETKRKSGKKCFPHAAAGGQGLSATFVGGFGRTKEEDLQLGTTKTSTHLPGNTMRQIPCAHTLKARMRRSEAYDALLTPAGSRAGYAGHIPKIGAAVGPTVRDPNAKNLIIENYTPYTGYTGRLGR